MALLFRHYENVEYDAQRFGVFESNFFDFTIYSNRSGILDFFAKCEKRVLIKYLPLFRHEMRKNKKSARIKIPRLKPDLHTIFAKLDRERTESPLKKIRYLSRHALISLKTKGPGRALTTQTHISGHSEKI